MISTQKTANAPECPRTNREAARYQTTSCAGKPRSVVIHTVCTPFLQVWSEFAKSVLGGYAILATWGVVGSDEPKTLCRGSVFREARRPRRSFHHSCFTCSESEIDP
jgi:hypothetical protein